MRPGRRYRWEWELESSPEALWPLVADTNRFNRDTGLPGVEQQGVGPNARRRLRLRRDGVPIEWEEEPFEWVRPRRFGVVRRYPRGPVEEMRVTCELRPRSRARRAPSAAPRSRSHPLAPGPNPKGAWQDCGRRLRRLDP